MQALQNFLRFLNTKAATPKYLGIFHIVWIVITIAMAVTLCMLWKKGTIKKVNKIVLIFSLILLILGLYKQIVLSFTYEPQVAFNYNWNNFPWHLSSLPLIIGLLVGATSGSINKHFLSYYATFGLVTGLWGLFQPHPFVSTVGLNVYSMLCYSSMIALAVLILVSQSVRIEFGTFAKSLPVFAMVFGIAITFNEITHLLFQAQGGNMFAISRHCPSDAPVYSWVHNTFLLSGNGINAIEFIACILFYFVFTALCAFIPFALMVGIKKLSTVDFDIEYEKNDALAQGIRKSELADDEDNKEIFTYKGKVNSKKNTYLKTYFENLNANFGNNNKGSCGYVATAMLLSYYDTVLNEKIVPRQFDSPSLAHDNPDFQNSPGIKFYHPSFNPEEISYKEYVKVINRRKSTHLHELLLSIAIKKDLIKDVPDDKNAPFSDKLFGISKVSQLKKITQYYLKNIAMVKGTEYDIHTKTADDEFGKDIRNYVIRKVRKGYPVIVGINDGAEGHVAVAYDYDKKTDTIYFHMGWKDRTHVTLGEVGYDRYSFAMILDFDERKISRTHTDNYEVVINGALFYYCLDGRYTTPDDLVVEFGVGKNDLSIIGVYSQYAKEKLTVPEYMGSIRVANIGKAAFQNQRSIQQVVLSCEIPAISKKAFDDCTALQTVVVPASVKKIGRKAFRECRSLTAIMFLGTKDEWNSIKKRGAWDRKTGNYRVYCVDGVLTKLMANGQSELL